MQTSIAQTPPNSINGWADHYASPAKFGAMYGDYISLKDKRDNGTISAVEKTQLRAVELLIDGRTLH
jgi:hypothetical protein